MFELASAIEWDPLAGWIAKGLHTNRWVRRGLYAGAGLLAALGAGPARDLARGGRALATAPDDALSGLLAVRERLPACRLADGRLRRR